MAIGNLEQRIKGNASGARGTYSKNREIPLDEMKRFWDWMTVKEDNNKTRHENLRAFVISEIKRQGATGKWWIFLKHCQGVLDSTSSLNHIQNKDGIDGDDVDVVLVNECLHDKPYANKTRTPEHYVSDSGEEFDNVFLELTATVLRRSYLEKYDEEKAGPKGCKAYMMKMFAFTLGHYHQDFMSKYVARLGDEFDPNYKAPEIEKDATVQARGSSRFATPVNSDLGWGESSWLFEPVVEDVSAKVKPNKKVVVAFDKIFASRKA